MSVSREQTRVPPPDATALIRSTLAAWQRRGVRMFKRQEKSDIGRIDTLIGRGTSVSGDVEFTGGLHVDGRITGNVRATAGASAALSVSEHGIVEGSVDAPNVVLNGRVNGDIFGSERVVLGAKARVQGNVHYGAIEMALGAEIVGKLVPRVDAGVSP
jgi:cytoskeletal protein CcmA (bactofilin family)